MKNIEVNMGDIAVVQGEYYLTASGIGSCLVITLYDAKQRLGALAHTMLWAHRLSAEAREVKEERRKVNPESPDTKYADIAIEEMLKRVLALGAKREGLVAKLIGGANMFSAFVSDIGKESVESSRIKLKKEGIAIVGECVGGSQGRSVEFSVNTGIVTVKTKF